MKREEKLHAENKIFFDKVSCFYDSFFGRWQRGVHLKVISKAGIPKNKKSKILDAGCGTGNLLKILEKNKLLELYGVDLSEKMLNKANGFFSIS